MRHSDLRRERDDEAGDRERRSSGDPQGRADVDVDARCRGQLELRLVDTGIHSKGWTRDQVVDFFRKSGAVDEPTIQSETDRYIAWPAQALSYKLGQLKIRELRDRAQKELGTKFDIRTFHDEMLDGGTLPLDLLESRTNNWIAHQKSN